MWSDYGFGDGRQRGHEPLERTVAAKAPNGYAPANVGASGGRLPANVFVHARESHRRVRERRRGGKPYTAVIFAPTTASNPTEYQTWQRSTAAMWRLVTTPDSTADREHVTMRIWRLTREPSGSPARRFERNAR